MKKSIRISNIFFLLLLFLFSSINAVFGQINTGSGIAIQEVQSMPNPPLLDSLLAQHLTATGGIAWDSIQTAKFETQVTPRNNPNFSSSITYHIDYLKAHRMDIKNSFSEATICVQGNGGWSVGKFMGETKKESIDNTEAQELKYQMDITGSLHRPKDKGYEIGYIGIDTAQGLPAYKIQVSFAPGITYCCFLNCKTLLEVKRIVDAPIRGQNTRIEFYYSDFKKVNQLLVPHRTEMHNRKGVMIFEHREILFNLPLDARLWLKPE